MNLTSSALRVNANSLSQPETVRVPFRAPICTMLRALAFLGLLGWLSAVPLRAEVAFDPAPLLQQASRQLEEGHLLECVDTYHSVANHSASPKDKAFATVRMADIMALFLDRKDEALQLYDLAIRDYPGQPALENALFNRAMILFEQGRLQRSRKAFQQFLSTFPQSPRSFTARYMVNRIAQESEARPRSSPQPATPKTHTGDVPTVRVALANKQKSVRFTLDSSTRISGTKTAQPLAPGSYTATAQGRNILLSGRSYGKTLTLQCDTPFRLGKNSYKGRLRLSNRSGNLLAVNILPLETYLQGVVPREMSPSWDIQALMAQAVAARSYAWFIMNKMQDKPYDVAATTASQVYGGADVGSERTRKAVLGTRGLIVAERDAPVLTYFHAHSGGQVEDDVNVWTADMPYYQVGDDAISQSYKPLDWKVNVSEARVVDALRKHGFNVSRVLDMTANEVSPSGRMVRVALRTDTGTVTVKANSLRLWLGATRIKSVLCTVRREGDDFVFSGRGYGHGVGMSQWGAQGMAKQGQDYRAILTHYYPGTTLARIY